MDVQNTQNTPKVGDENLSLGGQETGSAFGLNGQCRKVSNNVSGIRDDYKVGNDYVNVQTKEEYVSGIRDDYKVGNDYVNVQTKEEFRRLVVTDPDAFAELYSASTVHTPEVGFIKKGCSLLANGLLLVEQCASSGLLLVKQYASTERKDSTISD